MTGTYPSVVRGMPYVPPPPPIPDWRGYAHTWIDHTGRRWPLTDEDSATLLLPGVKGLDDPETDLHLVEHAGVAGSRYRGSRTLARTVVWQVMVETGKSSIEWLQLARDFKAAFRPDRTGTWEAVAPDGQRRYLKCRLRSKAHVYEYDPAFAGYAVYDIEMVAEDPYWRGDPIKKSWTGTVPRGLIPPKGEPLVPLDFGSSATFEGASIPNPGHVAAWAQWTLTGPLEDVRLRVAGGELGCPDLAEGQVLTIDTDRRASSIRLDGQRARRLIRPWDPRAIPPGGQAPVEIEVSAGTGHVDLSIIPRYRSGV